MHKLIHTRKSPQPQGRDRGGTERYRPRLSAKLHHKRSLEAAGLSARDDRVEQVVLQERYPDQTAFASVG
jgi:hypothetical protein